jgi:hypothetical protein
VPAGRRLTVDEIYTSLLNIYRTNEMGVLEGAERGVRSFAKQVNYVIICW